ncbi:MAG: CHAT domain-containing protein, partial [Cyanobacteria bacterium J06631_2]
TDTLPDSVLETPVLGLGLSKAVGDFIALPHVETELDEIVKEDDEDEKGLFPGIQFLNDDFNWSNLFNKDRDQKILHIATHGKFSPVRQEDSYLMLGTGERLPVDELRTLQNGYLDETHLVVLSACQTGVSNQISGGAEINSISYYFLSGGAESVLASLWKVNDGSTSELMQRFYGYLASEPGITKATALQKAQRSFLNDSKFKHPHYWAPITLLGNGL